MTAFKKTIVMLSIIVMLATGVFADVKDDMQNTVTEEIKIVVFGNSILAHGKSESLGWYGDGWGMAASSADKDYFNILKNKVYEAGYTNVKWFPITSSSFEKTLDKGPDYNYKTEFETYIAPALNKNNPDVIIFQIGENVSNNSGDGYANTLTRLAEYCVGINPDVEIIFCKPFWGGVGKNPGTMKAAIETGFVYADLSQFNNDDNKAIGLFENSAVANHPGDLGMSNIANEIYSQLKIILDKKYVNAEKAEVKLNGRYMTFDVPAQIINGRIMIPVRAISEAFGAAVDWDEKEQKVIISCNYAHIEIVIGETYFTKNFKRINLDVPAQVVENRTLVPIRAIAEALDCDVNWNDEEHTAIILKS